MATLFRRIQSLAESYDELLWLRAQVAELSRQERKKKVRRRRPGLKAKRPPNRSRRASPVRKRRSVRRR